jgi:4-amino-4-deoxy-L-arabinose transferase-like glycosyltransferase
MTTKLHPIWLLIAGLILFRLVTLAMYPLIDTTEARYGEIARIMIETNNWVTPQFDYGIPFWGKPPLHTWASAISGVLFGVSEFSLRLPHLLTSVVTLLFVGLFAVRLRLSRTVATLVLCSSLGFFVASGMIMTDSLLLLGMTMAMTGFFIAWHDYGNDGLFHCMERWNKGICVYRIRWYRHWAIGKRTYYTYINRASRCAVGGS